MAAFFSSSDFPSGEELLRGGWSVRPFCPLANFIRSLKFTAVGSGFVTAGDFVVDGVGLESLVFLLVAVVFKCVAPFERVLDLLDDDLSADDDLLDCGVGVGSALLGLCSPLYSSCLLTAASLNRFSLSLVSFCR